MAMLFIVDPVSVVVGTVGMGVSSFSMGLVVEPLTLVHIPISMDQLSLAICFIVPPLALVAAAIGPQLMTITVSQVVEPLASVCGPILKSDGSLLDSAVFIHFSTFVILVLAVVRLRLVHMFLLLSLIFLCRVALFLIVFLQLPSL